MKIEVRAYKVSFLGESRGACYYTIFATNAQDALKQGKSSAKKGERITAVEEQFTETIIGITKKALKHVTRCRK